MKSLESNAARKLIKVLGFFGFIVLTFALSFWYFESRLERPVEEYDIQYFPAVVVTSENAELIALNQFDEYKLEHPGATFLIPNGSADQINERLRTSQSRRPGAGMPEVRVIHEDEEGQLLELEIYIDDGLFESRYKATADSVIPMTVKSAGPGFIFFPMATTAAAIVLVSVLSLAFASVRRRSMHLKSL